MRGLQSAFFIVRGFFLSGRSWIPPEEGIEMRGLRWLGNFVGRRCYMVVGLEGS